jgi:hypothetical protein
MEGVTGQATHAAPIQLPAPDLRQRAPRSPRQRLGGFVWLPRLLDKGRATLVGTNGDYEYGCLLDQRFFDFIALEPEALQAQLAAGKTDAEALQWILEHSARELSPTAIAAWSAQAQEQAPSEAELRQVLSEQRHGHALQGAKRLAWFELLERHDRLRFGPTPEAGGPGYLRDATATDTPD